MLVINDKYEIQEAGGIFARTCNMRGSMRKTICITIPQQENVTYEVLNEAFSDGAKIIRQEIEMIPQIELVQEPTEENPEPVYEEKMVEKIHEYDLTNYEVAGDIIDKRNGIFEVYMCEKTEAEQLNEELANLILNMGGNE